MSVVFNASGGIVALPSTPINTLNFAIKASLGQNQITRNIGNFYTSWDASEGAVQQQISISNGAPLVLPTGTAGLLVSSNGGPLNLTITKTTGTTEAPVVSTYNVYVSELYITDDQLTSVTISNPTVGGVVTGFVAYVPYTGTAPAPGTSGAFTRYQFIATQGQTVFPVSYVPTSLAVFQNGFLLGSDAYAATDGANIVLATPANAGDEVQVITIGV
jgi:hypothetical protein